MAKEIKIAAMQLCSNMSVSDNLISIDKLVAKAHKQGANYILTPEMSLAYMANKQQLSQIAKPYENNSDILNCAFIAKKYQIFLHIGSMAIKLENNKFANRSILFSPNGEIIAYYDKIHLFDANPPNDKAYRESDDYQAGNRAVIAKDLRFNAGASISVGMSICYDLRFANLYKTLALAGAQIISVPAAFTVSTGSAHWETLLRARAIETGSYIIAAAQVGEHENKRQTWGHSMIIDPWGTKLGEIENDEQGIIIANIELEKIIKTRQNIPNLKNSAIFSLSVN